MAFHSAKSNSGQFPTAKQETRYSTIELGSGDIPDKVHAQVVRNVEVGNTLLQFRVEPPGIVHLAGDLHVAVLDGAVVDALGETINRLERKSVAQPLRKVQLQTMVDRIPVRAWFGPASNSG